MGQRVAIAQRIVMADQQPVAAPLFEPVEPVSGGYLGQRNEREAPTLDAPVLNNRAAALVPAAPCRQAHPADPGAPGAKSAGEPAHLVGGE